MSRTNIDLDDALVARAMRMYGLNTKKSAVELALERLVGPELHGPALVAYLQDIQGSGWDADHVVMDDSPDELGDSADR